MRKSALFLSLLLILTALFPCLSASAFTPSDFEVTASSAMMVNIDSGDVVYSKNTDSRQYVGAISNLMTALVVCDNVADIDNTFITIDKKLLDHFLGSGAAMSHFSAGQSCSVRMLLQFLLVSSGSDAALILADYVGGGDYLAFVDMMNDKADKLGMDGTNYVVPYGLYEDEQYSTAADTYKLMTAAFKNDDILSICSMSRFTADANEIYSARAVVTTNYLINKVSNYYYRYAVAGKTGYTDAGGMCIASMASKDGVSYYCILLGCPKTVNGEIVRVDMTESIKLYKWAFSSFSFKTVTEKGEPIVGIDADGNTVGGVNVDLSWQTDYLQLYAANTVVALMPNDADRTSVIFEIDLQHDVYDAPIKSGDLLGTASIVYGGEKIGEVGLVAADSADYSFTLHVIRGIKWMCSTVIARLLLIVLALGIILGIIFIIISNRRRKRRNRLRMYKRL